MTGQWPTRYLVDNNTLTQMGQARRASAFFRKNVTIPEDVLAEASGHPDIGSLRKLALPTTPNMLRRLVKVMASVDAMDTKLVDLYKNSGRADPAIIACALALAEADDDRLFPVECIIVTGDDAVRSKATEFGLHVMTNDEFAVLCDSATPPTGPPASSAVLARPLPH